MSEGLYEEIDAVRIEHEQLANRMSEVEGQMDAYAATFDQMHRLLDLAEERARQIEETAQLEADRLRVEAQQHVEAVLSDLDSKIDQKKDALRQLSMLEFGMMQRAERAGIPPRTQAPTTAMTVPSHSAVVDSEAVESFAAPPSHDEGRASLAAVIGSEPSM